VRAWKVASLVALGGGLPLFKDLAKPLRMDLAEAKSFLTERSSVFTGRSQPRGNPGANPSLDHEALDLRFSTQKIADLDSDLFWQDPCPYREDAGGGVLHSDPSGAPAHEYRSRRS
jgi:hypothetical protein